MPFFCQNAGSIDRGFTTASRTGKNGECGLQLHVGVFLEKYAAVKEDDEMRIYWVKAKIEADCFGMVKPHTSWKQCCTFDVGSLDVMMMSRLDVLVGSSKVLGGISS
jgi:hypothetical protein